MGKKTGSGSTSLFDLAWEIHVYLSTRAQKMAENTK